MKIISYIIAVVSLLAASQISTATTTKRNTADVIYIVNASKAGHNLGTVQFTMQEVISLAGTLHETWYRDLPLVELSVEKWADIFANSKPTVLCKNFMLLKQVVQISETIDIAPSFVQFVNRQLLGVSSVLKNARVTCSIK